jgi:hypothetical protein
LNDASITALALEESLLREWNMFRARVDELPCPPGTRAAADGMLRFANNGSFADSVIDALELHLAGQNVLEGKLLSCLDLVLIQRAQPEDLTVLLKLAEFHARQQDLPALSGLSHRLQLYAESRTLGGVAKHCSDLLRGFDVPCDNVTWAQTVGIAPVAESWHLNIRLGTASPDFWLTRKSALKPQDTSLELLVSSPGQWRIQVARVDRLYSAQWRPGGITVDTDQPQLKALSVWPAINSHLVFPAFADQLAGFLKLQWHRTALITAKDASVDEPRLRAWLQSCADTLQL